VYIKKKKVKWSRYRPGVVQRVGRRIALLFHDRGARRGWVVSSTPRPLFTSGKVSVPIVQEAGRASRPVWTGGKSRPHRDSIPDRPARSQSLYRLSYPAHNVYIKSSLITYVYKMHSKQTDRQTGRQLHKRTLVWKCMLRLVIPNRLWYPVFAYRSKRLPLGKTHFGNFLNC